MSATPNLSLAHLLASQSQKDVTINQALDGLDSAMAGTASLDVSAGGTFTLTSTQWINARILLTGTPPAGVTIRLPVNRKTYLVDNHCGQTATVGYTSGTTVAVAAATIGWLYFDGTNTISLAISGGGGGSGVSSFNTRTGAVVLSGTDVTGAGGALLASPTFTGTPAGPTAAPATNTTQLATTAFVTAAVAAGGSGGGGTSSPYDVGVYLTGTYTNSQILGEYIFPRSVSFPASMTGSYAQADAASTGTVSCTVSRNGTSIGTIQFAASTSATFVSFGATTFVAGDVLKVTAPATADATLGGVKVTLTGTRLPNNPITFMAGTVKSQGSAATISINYPGGIVSGHVLYTFVQTNSTSSATVTATGWTQIAFYATGGGMGTAILRRFGTGTESGAVTFTLSSGNCYMAQMRVYSNVNLTTPEDPAAGNPAIAGGTTGQPTVISGFVTTHADMLVAWAYDWDALVSLTTPTGFGNAQLDLTSTHSTSSGTWDMLQTAAGGVGTVTSGGITSGNNWGMAVLALQPL